MKNLKYVLILLVSIVCYSNADDFNSYKQHENNNFSNYKKKLLNEYEVYKNAQTVGISEFKKELKTKWKTPSISSKYKLVEYSKDLNEKKSIDYKHQKMRFEVHAKNQEEAMKKFKSIFEKTIHENLKDATKHDILEHKIAKILGKKVQPSTKKIPLLFNKMTKKEKLHLKQEIKKSKIKKYRYNKEFIYAIDIKLPNSIMSQNAMRFKGDIVKNAKQEHLPIPLIYAIIHSESAFNPMARSYVPAFGLMQIVPRSAGIDAYNYLYGYKKMLNSTYLYSPSRNIKIGSAYLHLVYYQYLKKIRNKQSRLYCTIAAYNTGAGNVAKAFTSSHNMNKATEIINKLSPDEVYARLLERLPYAETKNYLKIVNKRRLMYQKIFSKRS